jgi:hypothetical protein
MTKSLIILVVAIALLGTLAFAQEIQVSDFTQNGSSEVKDPDARVVPTSRRLETSRRSEVG